MSSSIDVNFLNTFSLVVFLVFIVFLVIDLTSDVRSKRKVEENE